MLYRRLTSLAGLDGEGDRFVDKGIANMQLLNGCLEIRAMLMNFKRCMT